jgi:transposase-like protein
MERTQHRYSAELKERLVAEIENGHLSVREAARDARTSVTMIQKWLDEYGRYKPKRDVVEVVMKSEQDRIGALEQALAEAHLKLRVYDELITQANKHFKTDLKKSFGRSPQQPAVTDPTRSRSVPSAQPSAERATPTTSTSGDSGLRPKRKR